MRAAQKDGRLRPRRLLFPLNTIHQPINHPPASLAHLPKKLPRNSAPQQPFPPLDLPSLRNTLGLQFRPTMAAPANQPTFDSKPDGKAEDYRLSHDEGENSE